MALSRKGASAVSAWLRSELVCTTETASGSVWLPSAADATGGDAITLIASTDPITVTDPRDRRAVACRVDLNVCRRGRAPFLFVPAPARILA
ncbi:MAG: hypothetical protein ACLPZR_01750 [Solirubrobacteraceae bacterium]